jgi:hypothetical protein
MFRAKSLLFGLLSFLAVSAFSQKKSKEDLYTRSKLELHVKILADQKMEGRRTGTDGANMARDYIKERFLEYGLQPAGEQQQWFQPFTVNEGKEMDPSTFLILDGEHLNPGTDFYPLAWSKAGALEAIASPSLRESWAPWFIDLKKVGEGKENDPHFDWQNLLREQEKIAASKGATALLIYQTGDPVISIPFDGNDAAHPASIPVLFITEKFSARLAEDDSHTWDIQLKVAFQDKKRTGYNVVGLVNNNAPATVLIGAHYDHIGYGEDKNSLNTGLPDIHNGADDNASGTAALIELSRLLKLKGKKDFNYLFVAFSGEELGLYGSRHYTEHPEVKLTSINYMINLDMIGRLNDSSGAITIGGVGTSPSWGRLLFSEKKIPFRIKTDSSGVGPSDHTSFYRKGIPVLYFFTGLHSDYHRPSDDIEKINFEGQLQIVNFICRLVQRSVTEGRLVYTKTREQSMTTGARFSVSLGIMPDYTFNGPGVKADGISSGKPAEKAGILAGDIILALDQHSTSSLESYMQALSRYRKGDPVKVKVRRGDKELFFSVVF